jgi:hypothetical protein
MFCSITRTGAAGRLAIEFQLGLWLLHRKPSLWEHPDRFDPVGLAPTASISECTQRFIGRLFSALRWSLAAFLALWALQSHSKSVSRSQCD